MRAERDEWASVAGRNAGDAESERKRAETAEAARDAYKAALEKQRQDVLSAITSVEQRIAYAEANDQYASGAVNALTKVRAALSRESTANSPAIADSSRDDAGAASGKDGKQ